MSVIGVSEVQMPDPNTDYRLTGWLWRLYQAALLSCSAGVSARHLAISSLTRLCAKVHHNLGLGTLLKIA